MFFCYNLDKINVAVLAKGVGVAYLRIANLKKKYRISRTEYQEVLKGVNVEFKRGELVAVLGGNGLREIDLTKGELQALERVDGLYQRGKWRDASKAYAPFAQNSRYAATKVAECFFLMQNYDKAKAWYRVLALGNARGGMAERLEEGRKMVTQVGMDGKGIGTSLFFLFILSAKKLYKLI